MDPAPTDDVVAGAVALEAGQLLLGLRAAGGVAADGRPADLASDERIRRRLLAAFPDDALLSEESPDAGDRRRSRRVWIVDPLDGTREYGEPPRGDWAVHVALVVDGVLTAGAVALPASSALYVTGPATPVPGRRGGAGGLRIAVSRTRPPAVAGAVAAALGATLVPMGSAGAKAMAVVRGDVDAYLHAGGQHEWDSAAPAAVAAAHGLHVSRLDGSPLVWNQPEPWQPDLLVCHRRDADQLLGVLAEAAADR